MHKALIVVCGVCGLLLFIPAVTAGPNERAAMAISSTDRSCSSSFTYAGAQNASTGSGIRATITPTAAVQVNQGHVAAWVGVGGRKLGPGGTDEWLQAGYSAMKGWPKQIYYEVTQPNVPTQYHTIQASLQPGEVHRIAVLEVKPNYWQVILDDNPVSEQIYLKGSHNRFAPQALAETWNGGTNVCNSFAFKFTKIQVAKKPGGYWGSPKAGYVWRDPDNAATRLAAGAFEARSRTLSARPRPAVAFHDVPPLLGAIASKLAGKKITVECLHQPEAVRLQPGSRHMMLSKAVCQTLVGYQMAQPFAPDPGSETGLQVALLQIRLLRGVAQAAGVPPEDVDCKVLGWLKRSSRDLGATRRAATRVQEASAEAFTASGRDAPPSALSIRPDCPFAGG